MNDAQKHVRDALHALEVAATAFADATACVRDQQLKDFDARALAVARTHAETAEMWARRAME
jgi:hypothetical protein